MRKLSRPGMIDRLWTLARISDAEVGIDHRPVQEGTEAAEASSQDFDIPASKFSETTSEITSSSSLDLTRLQSVVM